MKTSTHLAARLALLAGIALAITGCSDGIPHVENPHAIVINGKSMTQRQFIEKYCTGAQENHECAVVRKAKSDDDSNRPMPKGW